MLSRCARAGEAASAGGGPAPLVSVIAVNHNSGELLCRCLDALGDAVRAPRGELLVIDNASTDASAALLPARFPGARFILNPINRGFGAACNQAFALARAPFLLLVNPDAVPRPGAVDALLEHLRADPRCGVCGGQLVAGDGKPFPSARRFPSVWRTARLRAGLETEPALLPPDSAIDWVPGTCVLLRRELVEELGGFDERFFLYFEETDLCRRARRAGWRVGLARDAVVWHAGGGSARTRSEAFEESSQQVLPWRLRSQYLYLRKHHGLAAVLADAGLEIGWHLARAAYNLRPGRGHARRASLEVVRHAVAALAATCCGRRAPPVPW